MRRYVLGRLLRTVPVVFGVVTVVFLLIHLLPGDPVEIMLGESAVPAQKEELRRELHLDRPILSQYVSRRFSRDGSRLAASVRRSTSASEYPPRFAPSGGALREWKAWWKMSGSAIPTQVRL